VLVNNAGGFWAHRRVTTDGLEHTFAVNHLAPFLLTNLLLDRLIDSAPARIVMCPPTHRRWGASTSTICRARRITRVRGPTTSPKLANVMFTYELSRRLDGTGVTVNALHPGVVSTSFGAEDPTLLTRMARPLMRFMKTPAQGAATSTYLASSPGRRGTSPASTSRTAHPRPLTNPPTTPLAADRLWQVSADLVGLTPATHS
jgi:NAD(P)-dependent dehydrogenase (short-subunit alcohol dehydrogenase family)